MNQKSFSKFFDTMANKITRAAGKPAAFIIAVLVVVIWALLGPVFHYSDTWQLVINTSTTIITFLMVFVIQQTQNKDTAALHLKMNELIASSPQASNRLVVIEELTEEELEIIKKYYIKLSQLAKKEADIHSTHSLDDAQQNHANKKGNQ